MKQLTLNRSNSCSSTTTTTRGVTRSSVRKIILPTITYTRIASTYLPDHRHDDRRHQQKNSSLFTTTASIISKSRYGVSSFFKSLLTFMITPISCKFLALPSLSFSITPSLGHRVTGTLFGNRRGHVSFAVQDDPKSAPVLIIEFATSTATLVKEMSSGLVRIALECEKLSPSAAAAQKGTRQGKLFQEANWTMYCNGRKNGNAISRVCNESDWHVLMTIQSVSAGAGVIPLLDDGRKSSEVEGELLYMRAKFERVVGSRDSEAFYMMNPDGKGGPELSIFLLRL